MKALTICQPYAEMIMLGQKPIENRTWSTTYRGELLIHAGKSRTWLDDGDEADYPGMVFGFIVGIATMVDCLSLARKPWPERHAHLLRHVHANGPWCFVLENIQRFAEPLECRGAQGLWEPPLELIARLPPRSAPVVDAALPDPRSTDHVVRDKGI